MTHLPRPPVTTGHRAATGAALVNGSHHPLTTPTTVAALVTTLLPELAADTGHTPRGVAVAIDDTVLPRSTWAATLLHDGDRVEVVTAVQGG